MVHESRDPFIATMRLVDYLWSVFRHDRGERERPVLSEDLPDGEQPFSARQRCLRETLVDVWNVDEVGEARALLTDAAGQYSGWSS
jgi:hypothetical protein